jgi:hypothetical protein|tara:strand:- start:1096 stop:1482 length:387 start_codon:yes stop_codon:yes gene_type:complete
MDTKLDIPQLDALFLEAGKTEMLLPRQRVKGITTSWLDIREEWSAYGYGHKRPLRIRPTAKQITNYDKALDLGLKLPLEDRKVIWSVSISAQKRHRPNWSKLGRLFKCDRRTVQHNYRGALMRAYYLQ